MKNTAVVFFAAVVTMSAAQECIREWEENNHGLEAMWPIRTKLNCSKEGIDAATTLPDGRTFFFKDSFYWRLEERNVNPGYPRLISQDWDGLPGNLDAALTWTDGRTFFFKGDQYWSFHGMKKDTGYPKLISTGFPGIPNNLDAAALWKNGNYAYFFKGNHTWAFLGGETCQPVTDFYPSQISVSWRDVPNNLDAALMWKNGITYFFKGRYYYRYNDEPEDRAGSPVLIHSNWGLRCAELNRLIPSVATSRRR